MISSLDVATIGAMALATYSTRLSGYLLLRNRVLSERSTAVLQAAPGCVLISVIAPYFVTRDPTNLIVLAVTMIAATRLPMLATIILAVGLSGFLRHFLP